MVGRDPVSAAADPNGGSLTTQLTQDEIASLSDDPNELAQQLQDMAGGNAVIKIDSFVGGALPPKAFIKSIRIVRDTSPAENHSGESEGVEIVTQAGVGAIRGGFQSRLRDDVTNGKNPFVDVKAPERQENFEGNLGGTIVPQKLSFSAFFGGRRQYDTPVATYTSLEGKQSTLLGRRPNNGWNAQGTVDWAVTRDQTMRISYSQNASSRSNLGIGGFDLEERAYSNESSNHQVRMQEAGPLGRRAYINTRLQLRQNRSASTSLLEAPTIRVLDGVTRGGAQVRGGVTQRDFELSSDVSYIRGIHTFRTGVQLEGRHYNADDTTNYLGTYVFSSNDDFLAGKPRNYTRRTGDPSIVYSNLETGVYVQDDLKLRENLTFSPGLRYEVQTHVSDYSGFAPRLGLTWAPGSGGKTTVRSSYGRFYNWLNMNTYAQTLRIDGFKQQELNILNPTFPVIGGTGNVTATNKYQLGDLRLEHYDRFAIAVDRTLTPKIRTSMTYSVVTFGNQPRGMQLERAGQRRAAGSELRKRHRVRVGCLEGYVRSLARHQHQLVRRRPQLHPGAVEPEAHRDPVQLSLSPELQQQRRPVQSAAERVAGGSMGADLERHPPRHARLDLDAGPPEPECAGQPRRQQRIAVHHHDGLRRQRRLDLQRSAAADAAQQLAPALARDAVGERVLHHSDRHAGGARRTRRRRARRRARRTLQGHHARRVDQQLHQPRELHRIQRRDDLGVLPAGDVGRQSAPGRFLIALRVLTG